MPSKAQTIVDAVRGYYNSPHTIKKFVLWGADPRRPGVTAAHLGLEDVERFHKNPLLRAVEWARHKRALERMTRLIIAEAEVADGQSVLDAGCGTGSVTFPIAERYPRSQVYGVSLSSSQLHEASGYRRKAGVENAHFSEQNFARLAFTSATFDRVFFAESFCHSPDKRVTVGEAARVLKPGGKLLVADALHLSAPSAEQAYLCDALGSTDGLAMADLLTVAELSACMEEHGLRVERTLDVTKRVLASLALIANGYVQGLAEGRMAPSALIDSYLAWYLLTKQGPLGYVFVRAVKEQGAV